MLQDAPGRSFHRLGTAAASRASRRFIQSTAPRLYSQTAARQAQGDGGDKPANPGPAARAPFSRPSFGRPAFGAGAASGAGASEPGRPAFGSGVVELTEEEQKLRDALKARGEEEARRQAEAQAQAQQRRISINRGPGPESSRAGRPDPESYKQHMEYKERAAARDKASELDAQRGQRFTIRRTAQPGPADAADNTWGQLRRRAPTDSRETDGSTRFRAQGQNENRGYTSPNAGARPKASGEPGKPSQKVSWRAAPAPESAPEAETNPAAIRLREEEAERAKELEERLRRREGRVGKAFDGASSNAPSRDEKAASKARGKDKKQKGDNRRDEFVLEEEEEDDKDQVAAAKAEIKRQKKAAKAAKKAAEPTPIFLPEYITVVNLAAALRVRLNTFTEKLEEMGFEETAPDFVLNGEMAGLIAQEFNFEPLVDHSESEDLKARPVPEDQSGFPPRSPVVTIMGHVDHGKTTILDFLRKSSVAAGEAGGITQHIGAFSVPMPSGKLITFLDTPGHSAFLNMRQRGANVTDIVVLVVAADDSVKPQTIEAINHAKSARVPVIVAVNKVDKEGANVERVKQDLARHNVEIEDFGGDTQVVCVSGKTGQGMGELEEAVLTLSDVMDMRADVEGEAEGWVLEASIKPMGKVATVLVRRGTLQPGDFVVAGQTWARIRCMRNEAGTEIRSAGPAVPVEIDGWKEQPLAGDEVLQAPTEQKAKSVVQYRLDAAERDRLAEDMEAINAERKVVNERRLKEKEAEQAAKERARREEEEKEEEEEEEEEHGPKKVYFIVKGDVSGSVEAVMDSVAQVGNAEIMPKVLRSGVGAVSEFDIEHAAVAKGYVISFNNPVDPGIKRRADMARVGVLESDVIYRLVEDVKATLSEYLPPLVSQKVLGEAEVAQVFDITIKGRKQKPVAGCKVRNGTVGKNAKIRVMRDGKKIFDGALESLKNVKKDVMEIKKGGECGMGFDGWDDFQVGDQVQAYETKEEKRFL